MPINQKTCDYYGSCKETPVQVPVTVKNPCVDPIYVSIQAPTLDNKMYTIATGNMDFIPEHDDFTIQVKNLSFDPA